MSDIKLPLMFCCANGCGVCGVTLKDFVTHATQAQDGDPWVTVASEPQIVSDCCGAEVEIWDERKQEVVAVARAAVQANVPDVANGLATTCDGKEQDAFEKWAAFNGYNMECHPLHYLFLDQRTSAARDAWKAGLNYATNIARDLLSAIPKG